MRNHWLHYALEARLQSADAERERGRLVASVMAGVGSSLREIDKGCSNLYVMLKGRVPVTYLQLPSHQTLYPFARTIHNNKNMKVLDCRWVRQQFLFLFPGEEEFL